jgi:hypothetical protein
MTKRLAFLLLATIVIGSPGYGAAIVAMNASVVIRLKL